MSHEEWHRLARFFMEQAKDGNMTGPAQEILAAFALVAAKMARAAAEDMRAGS